MRELPSVPINELIRTSIGSTVVGIVLLVFATLLFGVPSQSQEVAGGEAAVAVGASEQPGSESQPAESAVEPGAESGPAAGTGDATTSETVASGEGTQESGTGQPGDTKEAEGPPADLPSDAPDRVGGTVQGQVTDATTGRPVEGVRVVVQRSTRRFQSNNRGEYRLERLSTGALRVTAEKEGYVPLAQEAVVKEGEITSLIFRLSPILKEGQNLRVVLTWGDKPKDLDAHLWLPSANKSHIDHFTEHRGSMVNFPFAQLDLDATEGQGPETITVGKLFQGTYMYAVNQWSTDATLGGSGSTVRVYGESGLLHTFTVPEGKGRWWKVFELDGATSSIKGLNQLVERSPEPYPL